MLLSYEKYLKFIIGKPHKYGHPVNMARFLWPVGGQINMFHCIIMLTPIPSVNVPLGIKNAPTMAPTYMRTLMPQKPFCIPDLASLLLLTPYMMRQKKKKNAAMAKQIRYTAKYPTTLSQRSGSFYG